MKMNDKLSVILLNSHFNLTIRIISFNKKLTDSEVEDLCTLSGFSGRVNSYEECSPILAEDDKDKVRYHYSYLVHMVCDSGF